jgi:hypothetical protein
VIDKEERDCTLSNPSPEVELTLNELKDAHWLYDTPGIMKEHDVSYFLFALGSTVSARLKLCPYYFIDYNSLQSWNLSKMATYWSKVVHYIGNRVPFQTHPCIHLKLHVIMM